MTVERKRIFVLVKTYPTISATYGELVCTAGILEDGTWIRLYPVPFRLLKDESKYKKYTWINVNAERNTSDFRIESYRPDIDSIETEPELPKIRGRVDWGTRKQIILGNQKIYTNLRELISEAKTNMKSLAVFKPSKIIDVIAVKRESGYKKEILEALEAQARQFDLFKTPEEIEEELRPAKNLPYAFKYKFVDDAGTEALLTIEDWEIGMLYINCMKRKRDPQAAIQDVRKKYIDDFARTKYVYFFLGTTMAHHYSSPNPFIIIGVFPPLSPAS